MLAICGEKLFNPKSIASPETRPESCRRLAGPKVIEPAIHDA